MGEVISTIDSQFNDLPSPNQPNLTHQAPFIAEKSDIDLFLPLKNAEDTDKNTERKGSNEETFTQETLIKQVRTHLFTLTNLQEFNVVDARITTIIQQTVTTIDSTNTITNNTYQAILDKQKQLQLAYTAKLKDDKLEMQTVSSSVFERLFVDSKIHINSGNDKETSKDNLLKHQTQQPSDIVLKPFLSILLVLVKSVQKTDSGIVYQILAITKQFIEQIPVKYFAIDDFKETNFITLLKPLSTYVRELSVQTIDVNVAKQATEILLSTAIAKASLMDLLPLLPKLIFNTDNITVDNVHSLVLRLNEVLSSTVDEEILKKLRTELNKENNEPIPQETMTITTDTQEEHLEISNPLEHTEEENQEQTKFRKIITKIHAQRETQTDVCTCFEANPLEYLKALNLLAIDKGLMALDESQVPTTFLASVLLAYIDLHNELKSTSTWETGSVDNSFSFSFHPNTFRQLFNIIKNLSFIQLSGCTAYILVACLRLFTTHLKFLIKSDLDTTEFISDTELQQWKEFMLRLITENDIKIVDNNQLSVKILTTVRTEASKAFIYLLEKLTPLNDKLQFIYNFIVDNKHPILIQYFLIYLHDHVTLKKWIELLSNGELKQEKHIEKRKEESIRIQTQQSTLTLLYSYIDICLQPNHIQEQKTVKGEKVTLHQVFLLFQELLFVALNNELTSVSVDTDDIVDIDLLPVSVLVINYVTRILTISTETTIVCNLLQPILIGLCVLTHTKFNFTVIQPIFTAISPLLVEYLLCSANTNNTNTYITSWLLGKISNMMLNGKKIHTLEKKHFHTLNWPLFGGGNEITSNNNKHIVDLLQSNLSKYLQIELPALQPTNKSDIDFLMSIYNNVNDGAQLLLRLKIFVKNKQQLQTSIVTEANEATAALFAVYVKHYRRIELAKDECRIDTHVKPNSKLISLYQYAIQIQTLFATTKAQGGDCNELYMKIKSNTAFLLSSIKENHFIPLINDMNSITSVNDELSSTPGTSTSNSGLTPRIMFKRQISRWTKAKSILRLLRNTMTAIIRLKKLMLARKQGVKQKQDNESILSRNINTFIYEYKNISIIEQKLEADELLECMEKQYERAITRLIGYKFIERFMKKVLKIENNRMYTILSAYLPHLSHINVDWHYLQNIETSNVLLKQKIEKTYYSIINENIQFVSPCLSTSALSRILILYSFNLLNLSYKSSDLSQISKTRLIKYVFKFFSFIQNNDVTWDIKLTSFNWFRMLIFQLSDIMVMEEKNHTSVIPALQRLHDHIFHKLILNELHDLRKLKQSTLNIDTSSTMHENSHLQDAELGWFNANKSAITVHDTTIPNQSQTEIDIYTNQLLVLLLRCVHLYTHVRYSCSTSAYIQELLYIYSNSLNSVSITLSLKLLRELLSLLPPDNHLTFTLKPHETVNVKELLLTFLFTIGASCFQICDNNIKIDSGTVTELIYVYRTLMSARSSWQMLAIQLIVNVIKSSITLIESIKTVKSSELNYFLASLCVLGGHVQSYHEGCIVHVYENMNNDKYKTAVIMYINTHCQDSNTPNPSPYLIQYPITNKTEWITADKLCVETSVPVPNLLPLSTILAHTDTATFKNAETNAYILTNILGLIIKTYTVTTDDLTLLQIRRRCVAALSHILNNKISIEVFISKRYAPVVAQLALSGYMNIDSNSAMLSDLRLMNKIHWEQYSLSLDTCVRLNQVLDNDAKTVDIDGDKNATADTVVDSHDSPIATELIESNCRVWNRDIDDFVYNPLVYETVSINSDKYHGWKKYATAAQIQIFKHGSIGSDEIRIVSFPGENNGKISECGNKHKFNGKITGSGKFATYLVEDVRLNKGNWYYCVMLNSSEKYTQVGWATEVFVPDSENNLGVGDDEYSWSYDGSCGTLCHNKEERFAESIEWASGDVCGCGIEIDGENTVIKYWLNGEFLGTAFSSISNTNIKSVFPCSSMLPDEKHTTFFPALTVGNGCCEFIFSPEDMEKCPLPEGYKPLLIPSLINTENTLVAYPYNAYLVGDQPINYFHTLRQQSDLAHQFLRDFVNGEHIETTSTLEDINMEQQLKVPNTGISLSIDTNIDNKTLTAFTISFDFEFATISEMNVDERIVKLLTLDTESYTIPMTLNESKEENDITYKNKNIYHVCMIFQLEQRLKIYVNNDCRILPCTAFDIRKKSLNICILPELAGVIKNIGIWRYALSEQHIQRLFTYSLFYVTVDYQLLQQHKRQSNTINFKQPQFPRELLPFTGPFDLEMWDKKKRSIDTYEFKYFRLLTTNTVADTEYAIQLFGNNSYLVLDKSPVDDCLNVNERTDTKFAPKLLCIWTEYTIVMDIKIPSSSINERTIIEIDGDGVDESPKAIASMEEEAINSTNSNVDLSQMNDSSQTVCCNKSKLIFGILTLLRITEDHAVYITSKLKLRVSDVESETTLKLDEYFRLVICKQGNNIRVYVNGILELNALVDEHTYDLKEQCIYLFKETDVSNKTVGDNVRIECKSITFKNKCIDQLLPELKSTEYPLHQFVSLPFAVLSNNLISIGYKKHWIKSIMVQYDTCNIQLIDTLIRQQMQQLLNADKHLQHKDKVNLLCRLGSHIDKEKLNDFTMFSKLDTDMADVCVQMLEHWDELQIESISALNIAKEPDVDLEKFIDHDDNDTVELYRETRFKPGWYLKCAVRLGIHDDIVEWTQDKTEQTTNDQIDPLCRLLDLSKSEENEQSNESEIKARCKYTQKFIQHSNQQLTRKQYVNSRIVSETGLTSIYARDTILNMLRVWTNSGDKPNRLFPQQEFDEWGFVKLLRLMSHHYMYTSLSSDETVDRMKLFTNSIAQSEIEELIKQPNKITRKILKTTAPLLHHLQIDIIKQCVQFSLQPTLLKTTDERSDEKTVITQPNLNFVLQILKLFLELIKNAKKNHVDCLISTLFPELLINLLFDLFLLVSTHKSKVFILHVFTVLCERADNFNFNTNIQQFFIHFLQFATDKSLNDNLSFSSLRFAVIELCFVLKSKSKENQQFEEKMNFDELKQDETSKETKQQLEHEKCFKYVESLRNISTVIDIIKALIDKKKQILFPKEFIAESSSYEVKFTEEEINNSNTLFSNAADMQLIDFMNKNIDIDWLPIPNSCIADFITALPTDCTSDTKYDTYTLLSNIPVVHIRTRAKLLYLFNIFIIKVLEDVDLSLPSGMSMLTDTIRSTKAYILYNTKLGLFKDVLKKSCHTKNVGVITLDILKANTSSTYKDTIFYQAFKQLSSNAHLTFRKSEHERVWNVIYTGMFSADHGGPYRDSITTMCRDICSSRLPLFILCPNGRTNSGINRDRWIPNVFPPQIPISNRIKAQYIFIGQLMGMAMRTKNLLNLQFSSLLWKSLVCESVTIEDIEEIDTQSFTIINEMEKTLKQKRTISDTVVDSEDKCTDDNNFLFDSIMNELKFDIVGSDTKTYELVSDGSNISITAANYKEYCLKYREYRLQEFSRQTNYIRQGLYSVIPSAILTLFTVAELEDAVCGKPVIDIDLLRQQTKYTCSGDDHDTSYIQRFWTVLKEKFDAEQKKLFLVFVWGRSTLPNRAEDFQSSFTIDRLTTVDNVDQALPVSHTCFFTLDLPPYSTTEIMYERLNYAITHCSGIDADHEMNEADNRITMQQDSDDEEN